MKHTFNLLIFLFIFQAYCIHVDENLLTNSDYFEQIKIKTCAEFENFKSDIDSYLQEDLSYLNIQYSFYDQRIFFTIEADKLPKPIYYPYDKVVPKHIIFTIPYNNFIASLHNIRVSSSIKCRDSDNSIQVNIRTIEGFIKLENFTFYKFKLRVNPTWDIGKKVPELESNLKDALKHMDTGLSTKSFAFFFEDKYVFKILNTYFYIDAKEDNTIYVFDGTNIKGDNGWINTGFKFPNDEKLNTKSTRLQINTVIRGNNLFLILDLNDIQIFKRNFRDITDDLRAISKLKSREILSCDSLKAFERKSESGLLFKDVFTNKVYLYLKERLYVTHNDEYWMLLGSTPEIMCYVFFSRIEFKVPLSISFTPSELNFYEYSPNHETEINPLPFLHKDETLIHAPIIVPLIEHKRSITYASRVTIDNKKAVERSKREEEERSKKEEELFPL